VDAEPWLGAHLPRVAEQLAVASAERLTTEARRATYLSASTLADRLLKLALAIARQPPGGGPLQLSRLARQVGLSRQAAETGFGFYAMRDIASAFAAQLLATGELGELSFIHLKAVPAAEGSRSFRTFGHQGGRFPIVETEADRDETDGGRFVFVLATAVTTRGVAIPCGFEVVPGPHWRTANWRVRAEHFAPKLRKRDESDTAYFQRMISTYRGEFDALAGRPESNPLPVTMADLVGSTYEGIGRGEDAVGESGRLTAATRICGWLVSPEISLDGLSGASLATTLAPLRVLDEFGGLTLADVCVAGLPQADLSRVEWRLEVEGVAYTGAELHDALMTHAGAHPWVGVTAAAPPEERFLWFVARGTARDGTKEVPAALIALRDTAVRRRGYSARVCLDSLDAPDSLRRALEVAHADTFLLHEPSGAVQRTVEEVHRVGAFNVQSSSAAPREVIVGLALSVAAARLAAAAV